MPLRNAQSGAVRVSMPPLPLQRPAPGQLEQDNERVQVTASGIQFQEGTVKTFKCTYLKIKSESKLSEFMAQKAQQIATESTEAQGPVLAQTGTPNQM